MTGWVGARSPSRLVKAIVHRLEGEYGVPENAPRFSPMDELISCILSQHTSDATSYPTFDRMKEKYPEWSSIVDDGSLELSKTIKAAGLANQKAIAIVSCLKEILARTGDYSLDCLKSMPTLEARRWLMELPGVGPKTASIVLCFALCREVVPVDTHVHRLSVRIGLLPERTTAEKAHDLLLEVVPNGLAFRFHMSLIGHGRKVCRAQNPKCSECVISKQCLWFRTNGPPKRDNSSARSPALKGSARKV